MATPAQVLANQANAQHSTGPRTPEGKARSSRNSFQHGLTLGVLVAAGNNSFAIRDDGSLWIWGLGSSYPRVWPMQKNSAIPLRLEIPGGIRIP